MFRIRIVRLSSFAAVAIAWACSSAPPAAPPSLEGRWRVEMRTGRWMPVWMPGGSRATATVELRHEPMSKCPRNTDPVMCDTNTEGSFRLVPGSGFPQVYRDGKASFASDSTGDIYFGLHRSCGDCGEVEGIVRWHGGELRGGWAQHFLGDREGGKIRMTRVR